MYCSNILCACIAYDHMSVMLVCVVQDEELCSACGDGNLSHVQFWVKQSANVNSKSGLVSV